MNYFQELNETVGKCGGMNFSFTRQVNAPAQKEAVRLCQEYGARNGRELLNVSENPKWFERGADLIEETPDTPILIDVKCDERMADTGNVVAELIEICAQNGHIKKGWFYSDVHYIFYVDWRNKLLYEISLPSLRRDTFLKARNGFSAYHPNEQYFTLGVLVPIIDIEHKRHNL